jgi:hypothetical protein
MHPNPYASPRAGVSNKGFDEPSQWQRAKWVFGSLWLMLTALGLLNTFFVPPAAPSISVLVLNSLLALALAGYLARDMWLLKVRRSPLILDVLVYTIGLGGLVFLIVLKETKLYVWNELHLDVPAFLLIGTVAVAAWITEAKKAVRIYVGARHFIFVSATDNL